METTIGRYKSPCASIRHVLAVGCWGGSSNHEKGQGRPCRGTCTVQEAQVQPGAAPLVDIPMCSGMGEIEKEPEGGGCKGGRGEGEKKGRLWWDEQLPRWPAAAAAVASKASACCSSSGSSSREVSESGDEPPMVPSPYRTSAYPVPGISDGLLLAWVCGCGCVVGWSFPDCLSIFGCQSVCQSAHLKLPSATRNLQSAIWLPPPFHPCRVVIAGALVDSFFPHGR